MAKLNGNQDETMTSGKEVVDINLNFNPSHGNVKNEENSRLLYDKSGHLRYIGESSALAFLAQCRKLFLSKLGQSKFTQDPQRFQIVDSSSSPNQSGFCSVAGLHLDHPFPQLPAKEIALLLVCLFDENILYCSFIDITQLHDDLYELYRNPMQGNLKKICLLNLIMAIGALFLQVICKSNFNDNNSETKIEGIKDEMNTKFIVENIDYLPGQFFKHGVAILHSFQENSFDSSYAFANDTDSSNVGSNNSGSWSSVDELWILQAHMLIHQFHLLTSKRNAAWVNLGIAIRYAQSLGLNRKFINECFGGKECKMRRNIWYGVYVGDRLGSALMGRSMGVHDIDWDDQEPGETSNANDQESIRSHFTLLRNKHNERQMASIINGPISSSTFRGFSGAFSETCQHYMIKICQILGDVLFVVYSNDRVSCEDAKRLATDLKQWSNNLPSILSITELYVNASRKSEACDSSSAITGNTLTLKQQRSLLILHLTQLHTVMLLCRPFFYHVVSTSDFSSNKFEEFVKTIVQSSLITAQLVSLFTYPSLPLRNHETIYFTFHAGLVLGLMLMHQISLEITTESQNKLLLWGLRQIIKVLRKYGEIDGNAERYALILKEMYNTLNLKLTQSHILNDSNPPDINMRMKFINHDEFGQLDVIHDSEIFNTLVNASSFKDGVLLTQIDYFSQDDNINENKTNGASTEKMPADLTSPSENDNNYRLPSQQVTYNPSASSENKNHHSGSDTASQHSTAYVASDPSSSIAESPTSSSNTSPSNLNAILDLDNWLFPSFDSNITNSIHNGGADSQPDQNMLSSLSPIANNGMTSRICPNSDNKSQIHTPTISNDSVQVRNYDFMNEFLYPKLLKVQSVRKTY